ncbi:hypothetical protein V7S43_009163 [Phytophthora oleae]|uniref:Ankyrin repeat protein n=1 Tax=Phytophthora oleae TaxID=2107226 RepID=A0ABD3FFL6_9STRA
MKTRGIDLDMNTAKAAMDSAAGHGRLEVVRWLIERDLGRGTTYAIHFAAARGHLEVAKYLHAQGFTGCNQGTVQMAAIYLSSSGCGLSFTTIRRLVYFLYTTESHGCRH